MDDLERQGLQLALQLAIQRRVKLDATIETLTEMLGQGPTLFPAVIESEHAETKDVGPISVSEGEFYGMTSREAARIVLERAGRNRPLKTDELFAYIKQGGVQLSGKNARTTFARTIRQDSKFHRVPPSRWGLREWYPGSAVRKPRGAQGMAQPQEEPDDLDLPEVVDEDE